MNGENKPQTKSERKNDCETFEGNRDFHDSNI
jgi:hypothetical protein